MDTSSSRTLAKSDSLLALAAYANDNDSDHEDAVVADNDVADQPVDSPSQQQQQRNQQQDRLPAPSEPVSTNAAQEGQPSPAARAPVRVAFNPDSIYPVPPHVQLPDEPDVPCDPELVRKLQQFFELKQQGVHFNRQLKKSKAFRNPIIYEKLVQFCHLDECGSNLPDHVLDLQSFGEDSFYQELAKQQNEFMEKKEKARQNRTNVNFTAPASPARPPSTANSASPAAVSNPALAAALAKVNEIVRKNARS